MILPNCVRIAALLSVLTLCTAIAANVPATPPSGKYTCGVFLSGRYTFTQYLTLKDAGAYESSTGPTGRFHYETGSKRILFDSGKFQSLFGSYEPANYPMFRLSSREDAQQSDYTRAWRSQVCSMSK
jgi:hypothetical protein